MLYKCVVTHVRVYEFRLRLQYEGGLTRYVTELLEDKEHFIGLLYELGFTRTHVDPCTLVLER